MECHTLVRCLPTPSQEGRSPAGLKTGVAAPTYRPSVLPARAAGGGARASRSGRLPPSAPAAVAAALHQLVTDRRTLEVRSSAKALQVIAVLPLLTLPAQRCTCSRPKHHADMRQCVQLQAAGVNVELICQYSASFVPKGTL